MSLLVYSFLALIISIIILLRDFLSKFSKTARLIIALFALIPESVCLFEFLGHFFYWSNNHLVTANSVFYTKFTLSLFFATIGVQMILLFYKPEKIIKKKRR